MSIQIGKAVVHKTTESVFDPQAGDQLRDVYVGDHGALVSMAAAFKAAGARCTLTRNAGRSELGVIFGTLGGVSGTEVAEDRYELSTDLIQESIWRNPKLWTTAATFVDGVGGSFPTVSDVVAYWRDQIQNALKSGTNGGPKSATSTGFTSTLLELYQFFLTGEEAYEIERIILQRVRTVSLRYTGQVQPAALPTVYTTSKLVSTFSLPTAIADRLPSTPTAAPVGTTWGWRKRRDTSEYTYSGKVTEVKDWVFAPWPTFGSTFLS